MAPIQIGDLVPDLKLHSSSGKEVSLRDFKGEKILLYFYPKDDTPGCTTEACDFRTFGDEFKALNVRILGISKDSLDSHARFIQKYGLPFELLSDPEKDLMVIFNAWGEKTMYGKLMAGVIRSTFLIDENGILVKAWRNIKATGHVEKVLAELKSEAGL